MRFRLDSNSHVVNILESTRVTWIQIVSDVHRKGAYLFRFSIKNFATAPNGKSNRFVSIHTHRNKNQISTNGWLKITQRYYYVPILQRFLKYCCYVVLSSSKIRNRTKHKHINTQTQYTVTSQWEWGGSDNKTSHGDTYFKK